MIDHARSAEHYARIERDRFRWEPFLVALVRICIEDAILAAGSHGKAAKLLGERQQTISRYVERARERQTNVDTGHPELNKFHKNPHYKYASKAQREAQRAAADRRLANNPLTLVNQDEDIA